MHTQWTVIICVVMHLGAFKGNLYATIQDRETEKKKCRILARRPRTHQTQLEN